MLFSECTIPEIGIPLEWPKAAINDYMVIVVIILVLFYML